MKTIAFHSYKGGVGRTMLLVLIAHYLVRFGKRVVVLDLDFDAPGVPEGFDLNGFKLSSGGLYEFLGKSYEPNLAFENLKTLLIDPPQPIPPFRNFESGVLKILPVGNIGNREYWKGIINHYLPRIFGPDGSATAKGKLTLLRELLAASPIGEKGIEADYLLIDSRSGFNCYADVASSVADMGVVMLTPSEATEHASEFFANWERDLPSNRFKNGTTFLLSRIPPELPNSSATISEWNTALANLFTKSGTIVAMLPLASDLKAHLDRSHLFPTDKAPNKVVALHQDVIRVLAQLCPEICPVTAGNQSLEEKAHSIWQAAYNKPFSITSANRLFDFNPEEGLMRNPDDHRRNIAFRDDTLLSLLNRFFDHFTKEKSAAHAQSIMSQVMTEWGTEGGRTFGDSLANIMHNQEFPSDERARIKEWCRFDTSAGFGILEFVVGDEEKFQIHASNLFLMGNVAHARRTHRDYTAFFVAYAREVLSHILNRHVEISLARTERGTLILDIELGDPHAGKPPHERTESQ